MGEKRKESVPLPPLHQNEKPKEEAVPETSTSTAVEQEVIKSVQKIRGPGLGNCWTKLKNTKMCYIGMVKESYCMKTNQFQVIMRST